MNAKPIEIGVFTMSTLTQMIYTSYHCAAVQCKITVTNLVLSEFVSRTDCLGPSLPNEMHFSTRQNSLSTRQCLCPLERLVMTTRQLIAWAPVYLMRCIFPLDKIHCRLDNACIHSYNPYDSTMLVSTRTTCTTRQKIPTVPTTPCINLLSLANEMHFATRRPSYKTQHRPTLGP